MITLIDEFNLARERGIRGWLAWKLNQVSARLYDGSIYDRVVVRDPDGDRILEMFVAGDHDGCGIWSLSQGGQRKGYKYDWEEMDSREFREWLNRDPDDTESVADESVVGTTEVKQA